MPRKRSSYPTLLVLCATALLTAACAGEPVFGPAPTPLAPPETPAAPPATYLVTGVVVDSDDVPVAGAEAAFSNWSSPPVGSTRTRVVTDAEGRFSATLPQPSTGVLVSKEGYEAAVHYPKSFPTTLRLHQVLVLTAGDSAQLSLNPDDSFCGDADEFNCRRVHIRALSDGVLVAEVTDDAPPVIFTLSMGALRWPYPRSKRAEAAVSAGQQQFVDILRYWNDRLGPQTLTLRTSLEPR